MAERHQVFAKLPGPGHRRLAMVVTAEVTPCIVSGTFSVMGRERSVGRMALMQALLALGQAGDVVTVHRTHPQQRERGGVEAVKDVVKKTSRERRISTA